MYELDDKQLEDLNVCACTISDDDATLDAVLDRIGEAQVVLLGEATHGTDEFYDLRARLTRRLIEEKRFDAVAVEADWPDAYRINRYIRGRSDDAEPVDALADFKRFPQWMWRNPRVVELLSTLAEINSGRDATRQVGFYGLDLYSLYRSIEAVIAYLDRVDPDAAQRARQRYSCLNSTSDEPQQYGHDSAMGIRESCEDEAVEQLIELRDRAADFLRRDGLVAEDEQFFAEQNAQVVSNAEAYYRQMFTGRTNTWNLRDQHMHQTLMGLRHHLLNQGRTGRIVVWAHNSHLGDARATSMSARGELNLGQLVRETQEIESVSIGFTTYDGTVSAASDWDGPVELKRVRPAIAGSVEGALHQLDSDSFFLDLQQEPVSQLLSGPLYERAIGVIYRPDTEMQSHYFRAHVSDQFDGLIHVDRSRALRPLDITPAWQPDRVSETYPFGV